jgi:hypothetical protein
VEEVLPLVHVTGVTVIGEYKLRLLFEDGAVGDLSFEDREWRGVFEPLRDPARFAKVKVEYGTIVWPDDGLDMAPEPLYQAALRNPVAHPVTAVSYPPAASPRNADWATPPVRGEPGPLQGLSWKLSRD